ncbi:hypothetical protein MNBD_GAMMA11-226 [hydrothermal vent metagenome]|uniref:Methyltransferase FkbM domain-containing protein n=1 Tax=hydrothermal vent metagenome TaxID=652676 RepID=A0A3B0XLG4_9ZZZZ
MSLYLKIHHYLIENEFTRKYQRRLMRWMKEKLGCPDAYGDLISIARTHSPEAVMDIGSFIGYTIVRFTDELDVPVFGFEPTPATFQILNKKYEKSDQVKVFNVALSESNCKTNFFCNKNMQTNSLLDNDEGNINSFSDATEHVDEVEIEAVTLDSWMENNCPEGNVVIKSDIQGAEGLLIKGGEKTFKNRVIAFYSEAQLYPMYKNQVSFSELDSKLSNLGFVIFNIYPCMHDKHGKAIQTDVLWINSSLYKQAH